MQIWRDLGNMHLACTTSLARPHADVAQVPPMSSCPLFLQWGRNCSPEGGRRLWLVVPCFGLERCGQACLPVSHPCYLFLTFVFTCTFSRHCPLVHNHSLCLHSRGPVPNMNQGIKNYFFFPLLLTRTHTHTFTESLNNNKEKKWQRVAATAQFKSKLSVKPLIINLPCG